MAIDYDEICARCGMPRGDHLAKAPHASTEQPGMPSCPGFKPLKAKVVTPSLMQPAHSSKASSVGMGGATRNPSAYRAVLEEHQARLSRLINKGGIVRLKRMYDAAQQDLAAKMRSKLGAGLGDTFSFHQHRMITAQLRMGQMTLAKQMGLHLDQATKDAQVESLRSLNADVTRLEKHYMGAEITLPTEEASQFWGVINQRAPSLMRTNAASMARYGSTLVGHMEKQLGLSLATGETGHEAAERIEKTAHTEFWRAERIVRTEVANAYNGTHADGLHRAAQELPDIMMRWTEHVSDFGGRPMDDRVGEDSIALHGQVAPPGGVFTMPPDTSVDKRMWGKTWPHPVNRPNDRAILSPWRKGWGIPAWQWTGGRRVPM